MRSYLGLSLAAAGIAVATAVIFASPASAKPARCFTTDDGAYPCDFAATDSRGSFRITAPGRPAYALEIDQPGTAFGFVEIDGRAVFLPGQFLRAADDPACWDNDATGARVCAW